MPSNDRSNFRQTVQQMGRIPSFSTHTKRRQMFSKYISARTTYLDRTSYTLKMASADATESNESAIKKAFIISTTIIIIIIEGLCNS